MKNKKQKNTQSIVDRAVAYFSPEAGLKREVAKLKLEMVQSRAFEAAQSNPQNLLRRNSNSAVKEVGSQTHSVRFAVREILQNNPVAKRAQDLITHSVVSWGIEASIQHPTKQAEIDKLWQQWVKNCSVDGLHFPAIQQQVMAALVADGEVLIKKNIKLDNSVRLQVLEADYLVTSKIQVDLKEGQFLENGIIKDEWKRPVAYVLYKQHPGSGIRNKEIEVIPANEIIHLFRKDRPGQDRGVSWFAQVLSSLNMLDELLYTQLVRLKLAASITAVVTKQPSALPVDVQNQQNQEAWDLNPGSVSYIQPGETIEFPSIPNPDGFDAVTKQTLRQIAIGMGITYEGISGDLSQINFSSARIGDINFRQNIESWRWNLFIPGFLEPAFESFKLYCQLNGIDVSKMTVEWVPPQRMLMDPQGEIDAMSSAIRNGLQSYTGALRELGLNPKLHVKEIEQSNAMLDGAGIVLDSDPRRTAHGQLQSSENLQALKADKKK